MRLVEMGTEFPVGAAHSTIDRLKRFIISWMVDAGAKNSDLLCINLYYPEMLGWLGVMCIANMLIASFDAVSCTFCSLAVHLKRDSTNNQH